MPPNELRICGVPKHNEGMKKTLLLALTLAVIPVVVSAQKPDLEEVRALAEQGNARAQFLLGAMYANGEGVPEDDVEAVRWYRLAAEQGYVSAHYYLGLMYYNGEGVPKDDVEAVRRHRLAAEQGLMEAQNTLGAMYASGVGVPEDDAEAVRWWRLAAEQGFASFQFLLGGMYANGEGVPEDDVRAYMWYNLAAAQGNENAQGNKDRAESRMTREQIAEGQRLSTEWIEAHPPGGN